MPLSGRKNITETLTAWENRRTRWKPTANEQFLELNAPSEPWAARGRPSPAPAVPVEMGSFLETTVQEPAKEISASISMSTLPYIHSFGQLRLHSPPKPLTARNTAEHERGHTLPVIHTSRTQTTHAPPPAIRGGELPRVYTRRQRGGGFRPGHESKSEHSSVRHEAFPKCKKTQTPKSGQN